MTNKLFYTDPYLQSFSAVVLKQNQDENGSWYVVLNQTAFYPTGGGQPYDTGMIGDSKVINVEEIDGEIRHYLEAPLSEIGAEKNCQINWERRFDHMQQHCGQHILSAAFEQLFDYDTVGFHLGNDIVTIDLETEQLTEEEAARAEELANQIIIQNRPIEIKWVTEDELSQYSLRKAPKVKENIRLVMIKDFDYNGCGGTHPHGTGEVSALKILTWERQRKNIRLQFVCGKRVINQLGQKQKILQDLTKLLNSPESEMVQAVTRILENGKSLDKSLEQAREQLLQYEAQEWRRTNYDENHVISRVFQNRSIQELQKLARMITMEDDAALVLAVSENENRLQLVCARGNSRSENMKNLIVNALSLINGKGGGNPSFAQGGGDLSMSGEQILEHLFTLLKQENVQA
ncbi:alanyl-tRNA editing protein [Neobacillus sp. YIM B02564]|jgi:alanyl-tRNA synthetase|uniref:Alanyl-tRNA editing protein n=1 Tax=Neobacillus paridis TaxID=2803862 RepID=A0ABS1TSX2_9BACI|nr:alanine--tRNA ligase-related protein [Neobacillus paridis]MBL4954421.1 alanyl-tRNA editing protein [Neobacillus paridis]